MLCHYCYRTHEVIIENGVKSFVNKFRGWFEADTEDFKTLFFKQREQIHMRSCTVIANNKMYSWVKGDGWRAYDFAADVNEFIKTIGDEI